MKNIGTMEELKKTLPYVWDDLKSFTIESNIIEGMLQVRDEEVFALHVFLTKDVSIESLIEYVAVIQPNAIFRDSILVSGVEINNHIAPPSGSQIPVILAEILEDPDSFRQHVSYETLHPFTDGNGRSGRALWLHSNRKILGSSLSFLHKYYYQSLEYLQSKDIRFHM